MLSAALIDKQSDKLISWKIILEKEKWNKNEQIIDVTVEFENIFFVWYVNKQSKKK